MFGGNRAMLILRAEIEGRRGIADVRIERGTITAIGTLGAFPGEATLDAEGGLLLPGLHDHHIHVAALAASFTSVWCGPPDVTDATEFAARLRVAGKGWLRGIGYHESIAGMLDAAALDRIVDDRPVRIQHRSGRMWFFNSAGLEKILAGHSPPPGLERVEARYTGRLFDEDAWLKRVLKSEPPSFERAGTLLAQVGITGLTDMSPGNDIDAAIHFAAENARGSLPQRVLLAGNLSLAQACFTETVELGPAKLHLHEAELPSLDAVIDFIRRAREDERIAAIHCTTEVELVFALQALEEAGSRRGDRIEHASIAQDYAVEKIAQLGLTVVTQPHFVYERGDAYRTDVDIDARPYLYRLRAFHQAGITLGGGSDAPFGSFDPWLAMASAVARRTRSHQVIGPWEALTPEEALDLFLRAPKALDERRRVEVGAPADLCLLAIPWSQARTRLASADVRATLIGGRKVFDRDLAEISI